MEKSKPNLIGSEQMTFVREPETQDAAPFKEDVQVRREVVARKVLLPRLRLQSQQCANSVPDKLHPDVLRHGGRALVVRHAALEAQRLPCGSFMKEKKKN